MSNAGHANDVIFNITYYRDSGNITFNYQSLASTWIQVHKFLSFMISANVGKHIIIKDIERQITLLELPLPKPLYGEEYGLLRSDLELVKDVIKIEERYGVRLNPKKEFTDDDLQIISLLAKSMRGEKSDFHWTDFSCNAILKPEVDSLDFTQIMTMSFNSTVDVMIQDQKITGLTSHIEFYNVLFAEPEKLQQSLVESENKKSIDIKMIPSNGENVAKVILQ